MQCFKIVINSSKSFRTFVAFTCLICVVVGFNLETRNPVVKRGEKGSYFGYSVALHKTEDVNDLRYNWMLVGAPLGQNLQPGSNHSGAMFKCPIRNLTANNDKDCEQVPTDGYQRDFDYDDGEEKTSTTLHPPGNNERKDGQWMGVSVKSQGPGGKIVVCAHRYMKTENAHKKEYALGLCYSLSKDLIWDEPLSPCSGRPMTQDHVQYGYCQAGTSLGFLRDGTVLIGSPGPFTWRGTMFIQNLEGDFLSRDTKKYMGPLNDKNEPIEKYSYLGMSVAAGKFIKKNELYYAAGAPRGNHHGRVYIFNRISDNEEMNVTLIIEGEVISSNFGYELLSTDLNNDGYDDLIVGAPFYFEKDKGGAVYIYYNLRNCQKNCTYDVKLTGKYESRFGFSLTTLGDINRDGYTDIAIGAPYEGGGAIYIYLGSKDGIKTEPSQKIHLEKEGVTTIGYSLSGGLDMDGNGYPDLMTGAYDSDMVILFRTRPIIDITTDVFGKELQNIDISKKECAHEPNSEFACFSFTACFTIKDLEKQHIQNVKVRSHIQGDITKPKLQARIWFKKNEEDKKHTYSERYISLLSGKTKYCQVETVFIANNTRDILNPIEFLLNYTLADDKPNSAVLNASSIQQFKATFQKDCGEDDVCESNLQLTAGMNLQELSKGKYTLDLEKHNEITILVNISNYGDAAYDAQLFIVHPPKISYIALTDKLSNVKCSPKDNNDTVSCMLGNPFKKDESVSLWLRFEAKAKSLVNELDLLKFDIFVNSSSKELSKNTKASFSMIIRRKAEVKIASGSTSFVSYGGEPKGESAMKYFDDIGSRVWHTYLVINEGPWEINEMSVIIDWPLQVASNRDEGKWLLYLEDVPEIEVVHSDSKPTCKVQGVNVLNLTRRFDTQDLAPDNLMMPPRLDPNFTPTPPNFSRRKREAEYVIPPEIMTGKDGKNRKIVTMDCMKKTAKCVKIICEFENVGKGFDASIVIKSRLWNSTLIEDYNQVDYVKIISRARIEIPEKAKIEQNTDDDSAKAETTAYPDVLSQTDGGVSLWVYIVAILVGLLLLIILVVILWKLGFFKRNRVRDPMLSGNVTKQSEAENLLGR